MKKIGMIMALPRNLTARLSPYAFALLLLLAPSAVRGGDDATIPEQDWVELATNVVAPIRHQPFYRGERELFGYRPRYQPNPVTFDGENRPYLRATVGDQGVVQTLNQTGQWIQLNFSQTIKAQYPNWNGTFGSGPSAEERIVFDRAGDAYMIVDCTRGPAGIGRILLLHSKDRCRTWQTYELPTTGRTGFQVPDGHNDCDKPPATLCEDASQKGRPLCLLLPSKGAGGKLSIPKPVQVTDDDTASGAPAHSGCPNSTVTKNGRTHIVYLSLTPVPEREGTPQYAVTFDHVSKTCSKPVLLGVVGGKVPDNHNGPGLAIDSRGYLHAVLGGHHNSFLYTRSLKPNSTTDGWTEPVPIGNPKPGYTYVSLVCDRQDTLHVVSRYSGDGYRFCLDYLRKRAGQPWEDRGHLVVPFRAFYSVWYHKLALDRKGRLFLNYSYYGNQLGDVNNNPNNQRGDEVSAYRQKWPDEPIQLQKDSRKTHGWWDSVKAHDPAILMTDDGGNSWRLAVTPDFR